MTSPDAAELATFEARLQALLPQEYQDSYEDVEPKPMGSAGLKFSDDGQVAWNEIWQSFCDLAMAGGPPHKGMLLEPASAAAIDGAPDRYAAVVAEICRGVTLATGLPADPAEEPGWVNVGCDSDGMAAWLLRAIAMENVSVRAEQAVIDLPAGPAYRLEKEIKNVVTVIAKTCHYWQGHMWRFEHRAIADLFARMEEESPLVVPALTADLGSGEPPAAWNTAREAIRASVNLRVAPYRYPHWIGVEHPGVRAAVWSTRMMVVSNVLARREETVVYVPINPATDPGGAGVAAALARVGRLWGVKSAARRV